MIPTINIKLNLIVCALLLIPVMKSEYKRMIFSQYLIRRKHRKYTQTEFI